MTMMFFLVPKLAADAADHLLGRFGEGAGVLAVAARVLWSACRRVDLLAQLEGVEVGDEDFRLLQFVHAGRPGRYRELR